MAEIVNIVAELLIGVLASMAIVGGIALAGCTALFGGCWWWLRRRVRAALPRPPLD